eukprot:g37422.t1
MLPGLECIGCTDMLDKLGLFSLGSDLIEVYKIMGGMDRVDSQNVFPRVEMLDARDLGLSQQYNLECKKLLKVVVCTAPTITEANLPSMDSIYMARCCGKAANIIKDPFYP